MYNYYTVYVVKEFLYSFVCIVMSKNNWCLLGNLFNRRTPKVWEDAKEGVADTSAGEKKEWTEEELFKLFVKETKEIRDKYDSVKYRQYVENLKRDISDVFCNDCEDHERYHGGKDWWCGKCYHWMRINFLRDELRSL